MNNGATNRGGGASGGDLTACTLVSNTAYDGGGSCSANVTDCVIVSNSASWGGGASLGVLTRCTLKFNSAYDGGGSDSSTLLSCLLLGNSAYLDGGGTDDGFLLGCTIVQNSAGRYGGGVSFSTLRNCIVLQNLAPVGANYAPGNAPLDLNYCCTQPLPTNGVGNINSDPLFLNATAGNFRLQSNSSCINFGNDSYTPSQTKDLDGRPRVVGRVLDIGAYEFDPRVSGYFLAWLQQYGLPTDGSADYADPDHDGVNNWQEWLAGTNPTNSASVELPRMLSAIPVGTNNVTVTWSSMLGASYTLQFATNITMPLTFLTVATNIAGQSNITTFTHTNPSASGQAFYRVGLQ
jgi:hypothetical protein